MKESNESKGINYSLNIISYYKKLFEIFICEDGYYYFNYSDYVVLKNKYFIIMINYHILIINLLTGKELIRYSIKNLNEDKNRTIGKWSCDNDNEFYITMKDYITLFKLDDFKEINLKIIAYYYFPNKIYEMEDNKFFIKNMNTIFVYSK